MIAELVLSVILLFLSAFALQFISSKRKQKPLPPSPRALPIIGHLHLLGPLVHQAFQNLSAKYGPLMYLRLGKVPFVVTNSPRMAKEFLKNNDLTFSSRKVSIAINMITYNAAFAFAPYNTYWKFIKKLSTTELLGARTIRQFSPTRTRELHEFIANLFNKSESSESVNLTQELMKLSNNIISMMMLSIKSSDTDSQAEEARTLVREVTQIMGEFNVSDFIGFCKNLDLQGFKRRATDIHKRYDALLEKIISDREQLRSERKLTVEENEEKVRDFLDILLDVSLEKDSEIKLTRNQIKALILDYFTAGTDTTTTTVEWTMAELINNPRVLRKAQEEVDRVTSGNKRLVCEADNSNIPYIDAMIKETMRLHPPITLVTRKAVQECLVDGYLIPKGTILSVNIWAMGRDPNIWENPLEFRPERFLEGAGAALDIKGFNFELLPFGTGRRGCPGMPLAVQALPTVIGALIQCFDWKVLDSQGKIIPQGNKIDMGERPGLTAPRADDLVCIPVTRVNPSLFLQI